MTLENILADFQLLDDWEDRCRYVIELGRALPPLPEAARTETNRVRGCASQVWLATESTPPPHLNSPFGASSPSSLRSTQTGARMKSFGPMRRACSGASDWPST